MNEKFGRSPVCVKRVRKSQKLEFQHGCQANRNLVRFTSDLDNRTKLQHTTNRVANCERRKKFGAHDIWSPTRKNCSIPHIHALHTGPSGQNCPRKFYLAWQHDEDEEEIASFSSPLPHLTLVHLNLSDEDDLLLLSFQHDSDLFGFVLRSESCSFSKYPSSSSCLVFSFHKLLLISNCVCRMCHHAMCRGQEQASQPSKCWSISIHTRRSRGTRRFFRLC